MLVLESLITVFKIQTLKRFMTPSELSKELENCHVGQHYSRRAHARTSAGRAEHPDRQESG
jgi:hypothetical protein